MLYNYIPDVLCSNPARTLAILTEAFSGFPQSLQPSSRITPRFQLLSPYHPDAIYSVNYWQRGKTTHTLIKEFLLADSVTWVRAELHNSLTVCNASEGFLRVNPLIGYDRRFVEMYLLHLHGRKFLSAAFFLFVVGFGLLFDLKIEAVPITVAARSKAWTVFALSNAGIVGSNPTQGMYVYVCVVLCAGRGLATGQGLLPSA
jgi:hypothetical protein